jgi:hypothetical protein
MKRDGLNTRGKFDEHTESFIVKDVAGLESGQNCSDSPSTDGQRNPSGIRGGAASPVKQPGSALLRDRHNVERDRHNARKTKLLRGCWRKINDPTFVEWSAIINPYYDCSAVFQIGDADECSKG